MREWFCKLKYFHALIILVAGFIAYSSSINGVLFWDDELTVTNNVFIKAPLTFLKEIFTTSYHSGSGDNISFYRPITTLSFALNYRLFGLNPISYHFTNVALHITNAILLLYLLYKVSNNSIVSFLSALLFVIHPINSEAVNYVSNRTDLLMFLFFLISFHYYIKFSKTGRSLYGVVSMALYVFSFLSKETGIVLPLFLLAYEYLYEKKKENYLAISGFIFVGIAYAILRMTILNFLNLDYLTEGAQVIPYSYNVLFRSLVFLKGFITYLRLLVLPINLHMEYVMPCVNSTADISVWILLVLTVGSFVFLFKLGMKNRNITFGALWVIAGLLPISGIIVPNNNVLSEHYLYLSFAGFFLLFSILVLVLYAKVHGLMKKCMIIIGVFLIVILTVLTIRRNEDWKNPLQMYLEITEINKNSFRAFNNAGVEYLHMGNIELAEKYLNESLEIYPAYAEALNNMGVVYNRKGDLKMAEAYFLKSIESKPDYVKVRNNLARTYIKQNKANDALGIINGTLNYFPEDPDAQKILEILT